VIRARPRWRLRASPKGGFDVALPAEERQLLAELPERLTAALDEIEPGDDVPEQLGRLFPVAHPRDPEAEADFEARARPSLFAHHRESLECLIRTADKKHLSEQELHAWLAALNDLRLVLGTSLGVTEEVGEPDPADARYADWLCYHYLSYLTGEVVDVLSGTLPPVGAADDVELPEDPWGEPLGGLRWDGTPMPEDS